MKLTLLFTFAVGLLVMAGCADAPETSENHLRLGLTREQLRVRFGEPVRIESHGSNGEDWYYRFIAYDKHSTYTEDSSNEFGQRTTTSSVGIEFTRTTGELPVHLSADGYVVAPLPEGKVVIN